MSSMLFLGTLALFFSVSVVDSHAQEECGVERWAVKTLSDSDTSLVRFDSAETTTVSELARLPKLKVGHSTARLPEERVVYRVTGVVTHYKKEEDRDLHLVLKALDTDSTIVIEVPDPSCPEVVPTSRAAAYANIMQWVKDSIGNPTTKFKGANKLVTVTGVRYADFWHNQRGMAHNCLELHPILTIQSAPVSLSVQSKAFASTLRLSPNPVRENLQIEASWNDSEALVEVIDVQGVSVMAEIVQVKSGAFSATLDVSLLPEGAYIIRISSESGFIGQKFILER